VVFEFSMEDTLMKAEVTTTEKSLLVRGKPELDGGIIITGTPNFLKNIGLRSPQNIAERDSKKLTWSVCPHLSEPDKVDKYYLSSGLIVIVFGRCFCENCLDMILSQEDLSELTKLSIPMTDKLFQEYFIDPLIFSNHNFSKNYSYSGINGESRTAWVSCPHMANKAGLKEVYSNGGQICIFESYLTCQSCFDKIPTDGLVDLNYDGTSMSDALFQEMIINPLYSINFDSLTSAGTFGFS
jgi:thiol-disulfide isomerase/thioredoxin